MNKNDLRNVLAKLHELENPVKENEPLFKEGALDFLRGIGAGEAKTGGKVKPKIEPRMEPHVPPAGGVAGRSAEEVASGAISDANKKLTLLRRVTPAEAAAAKAEGKTLDELLFNKFPETFAKFEKDPQLYTSLSKEFNAAADEVLAANAGGRGTDLWPQETKMFDKDGKKSLATSVLIHALIAMGLLAATKINSSSSSSSSSSTLVNSIPAGEIPWSTYLGMDPRDPGDWLERSNSAGTWKIIAPSYFAIGKINGPGIVSKIEKLAAMTPEQRKALMKNEPVKKAEVEVDLWTPDAFNKTTGAPQPTVKELPKAQSADKSADKPIEKPPVEKDADIGIIKPKKKTKKEEEEEKKKREAAKKAEAERKAEEEKKRKILPTLTF